jgi:hypothetical protein
VETTRNFAGRGDDRELDKDCGRNYATHRKVHPDVLLDLLAMSATFEKPLDTSVEINEATKDKDKKDGTILFTRLLHRHRPDEGCRTLGTG